MLSFFRSFLVSPGQPPHQLLYFQVQIPSPLLSSPLLSSPLLSSPLLSSPLNSSPFPPLVTLITSTLLFISSTTTFNSLIYHAFFLPCITFPLFSHKEISIASFLFLPFHSSSPPPPPPLPLLISSYHHSSAPLFFFSLFYPCPDSLLPI